MLECHVNRCRRVTAPKQFAGVSIFLCWLTAAASAQVVRDNTLGQQRGMRLTGPNHIILPELGKQAGGNLFHSFQTLNLAKGESATFTGPQTGIENVLTRVTGGSASQIAGKLECTIPDANFYFMNPAGVVFSEGASIDVKGSFAVTTADVIKLIDGGRFDARTPGNDVLTTARPEAFGFLGGNIGGIVALPSSSLTVADGKVLSVIGGTIRIAGSLTAPKGRVNAIAVASAGDVRFDATDPEGVIPASLDVGGGSIDLVNQGELRAGEDGGSVVVRAADLSLTNEAGITGGGSAAALEQTAVDINVSGAVRITGGFVSSSIFEVGRTGDIVVRAKRVMLAPFVSPSGLSNSTSFSTAATQFGSGPAGPAGNITVKAEAVEVTGQGSVGFSTRGMNAFGVVHIDAPVITLNGTPARLFFDGFGGSQFFSRTGSIILDGSLGAVGRTLDGPFYTVDANDGQQVGNNMFLSFESFSPLERELVRFTGPDSVRNVFVRVTGSEASLIDGAVGLDLADTNLFFINRRGVSFGSHGAIGFRGFSVIATANELGFPDGGRFGSTTGAENLSTQLPDAMRFESDAGPIDVVGRPQFLDTAADITMIGNGIRLHGARLSGSVNLISIAGQAELRLDPADISQSPLNVSEIPALNDIRLSSSTFSFGDVSSYNIVGNAIFIAESALGSSSDNAALAMSARRGIDLNGSTLSGNRVMLRARQLRALDSSRIIARSGLNEPASELTINADRVELDHASLESDGAVRIVAQSMSVSGFADPILGFLDAAISNLSSLRVKGEVRLESTSVNFSQGAALRAGTVVASDSTLSGLSTLHTDGTLKLTRGSQITGPFGFSDRPLTIEAARIALLGASTLGTIGGSSFSAQRISISAGEVELNGGSRLLGDEVALAVRNLALTDSAIRGGDIFIRGPDASQPVDQLSLTNSTVSTAGGPNGGTIDVETRQFLLSAPEDRTSFFTSGGSLRFRADEAQLDRPLHTQFAIANSLGTPPDVVIGGETVTFSGVVTLDGSLGGTVSFDSSSRQYTVVGSDDASIGGNVFLSFSQLDLASGESVRFANAGSSGNVIARVTGSAPSRINGHVQTDGAALFLLNPRGVVLGPGASLVVPRSVVFTTADSIELAEEGRFAGNLDGGDVLVEGEPAAFRFDHSSEKQRIFLQDSSLTASTGQTLSLIGREILMQGATLQGQRSRLNLVAAGSDSVVRLTPTAFRSALSVDGGMQGLVRLEDSGLNPGSQFDSGIVFIRGGNLSAVRTEFGAGGDFPVVFSVAVTDSVQMSDSRVAVLESGDLVVSGGTVHLANSKLFIGGLRPKGNIRLVSGSDLILSNNGISNATIAERPEPRIHLFGRNIRMTRGGIGTGFIGGTGISGGVLIEAADTFSLLGGRILTGTGRQRQAGDVSVRARRVELDGLGLPSGIDSERRPTGAGIFATFGVSSFRGGNVTISAEDLTLKRGITVGAFGGAGIGGGVTLDARDTLLLDGSSVNVRANEAGSIRINANTANIESGSAVSAEGQSRSGEIFLGADRPIDVLRISGGSSISVTTDGQNFLGQSSGGDIRVRGREILVADASTMLAQAQSGTVGGDIIVRASLGSMRVVGGSTISTTAAGGGRGGGIDLDAGDFVLDGSVIESTGKDLSVAGSVAIRGRKSTVLQSGASVSVESDFSRAGNLRISSDSRLTILDSVVTARSAGDSGNIKLTAPSVVQVLRSQIVAQAGANGGDIGIDPTFVILQDSVINGLSGGEPVEVGIDPSALLFQDNTSILSDAVTTPDPLDISGSLLELDAAVTQNGAVLAEACGTRFSGPISSFLTKPRGGVPLEPGMALGSMELWLGTQNGQTGSDRRAGEP